MRMCYKYLAILIFAFIHVSCSIQGQESHSSEALTHHLKHSQYTDPGEFAYLFDELPDSMEKLNDLIKKQLIHPFDLKKFSDRIPEGREFEDHAFPTVSQMLEELLRRDKKGLTAARLPENRLIVACVHHSMLLASILRYKGIPARIRAGHARYIGNDNRARVTHVVCEVWDSKRKVWFLVDPDRNRVDFNRQEFEFAFETWERLRKNNITKKYYISRYASVDQATAHVLCLDLSYVIGEEELYWKDPSIVHKIRKGIGDLSKAELQLLDDISQLTRKPDGHLDELIDIKENNSPLDYEE